jgi:ring-1,2-phenylacetyl-CoA epoxidase subunit PaaE
MLRFHSMKLCEIRPDAEDAVAVALEAPQEVRGAYRGLPGQHIVLRAEIDGMEVRRTYSLTSAPGEWPLRIAVRIHENGVMSRHLAERLRAGDRIDVLQPNGSLTPRFSDRDLYVGFASGCGITPVLSVARSMLANGSSFILFYGNRSTGRAMCLEEVLALKDRYLERFAVHFLMSREPQEVQLYNGRLDAERVRRAAQLLFDPKRVAECFVCGPGTMIEEVAAALRDCGIDAARIHGEHFIAASQETHAAVLTDAQQAEHGSAGGTAAPKPDEDAEPHKDAEHRDGAPDSELDATSVDADLTEVTLIMDGRRRSFTMRRNADILLDAAARAGLELPFSCRAGVCSTCRTKVVRGAVEMQENHALEDWELREGYVLACQSRATTPVLELDYDDK